MVTICGTCKAGQTVEHILHYTYILTRLSRVGSTLTEAFGTPKAVAAAGRRSRIAYGRPAGRKLDDDWAPGMLLQCHNPRFPGNGFRLGALNQFNRPPRLIISSAERSCLCPD